MAADIQCTRCGQRFPLFAYPPNRASVTGFSLICGGCCSEVRTGRLETAIDLIRSADCFPRNQTAMAASNVFMSFISKDVAKTVRFDAEEEAEAEANRATAARVKAEADEQARLDAAADLRIGNGGIDPDPLIRLANRNVALQRSIIVAIHDRGLSVGPVQGLDPDAIADLPPAWIAARAAAGLVERVML